MRVALLSRASDDAAPACRYFRSARVWRSLPPFVPVHHPKSTRAGVPKIDPGSGRLPAWISNGNDSVAEGIAATKEDTP